MQKLSQLIDWFYKKAISKQHFDKLLTEQFAIISVETGTERSFADEKAYRLSPIQYKEKREFEPIDSPRYKNLRKHKYVKEQTKEYETMEMDAEWGEEAKSPTGEKYTKIKKEKSMLFKNISFHNAYELAQKYGQESFIYKPHDGPVQLIPTNPSNSIRVAKDYAYSSSDNLYSIFTKDNSSIWFGFFSDSALELSNYGQPYKWNDPEIKGMISKEIDPSEAEKQIEKTRDTSKDILTDRDEWLLETDIKKDKTDKELSEILKK